MIDVFRARFNQECSYYTLFEIVLFIYFRPCSARSSSARRAASIMARCAFSSDILASPSISSRSC